MLTSRKVGVFSNGQSHVATGNVVVGRNKEFAMRAPIAFFFVALISSALSPCQAAPPDVGTGRESGQKPATSTVDQWTIKGREFSKSRSVNAIEFGLTAGSTSDQSTVLAKAIQHASESREVDTVYIPEGVYFFANPIWLRSGVNLIGDAAGKTVLERKDNSDYLLKGKHMDCRKAVVANLTLRNPDRTLLMLDVSNLQFSHVEFSGGIVRFEKSSGILLDGNVFTENLGKSAYAGSACENVRIVNNAFNSVEHGSINLSGHRKCHVESNYITSSKPIDSGYAGIRLPNGAKNNTVENNFIENHGRGIFILSSSANNIVRNNVVKHTTREGVLIQSSNNLLEGNTIIDAGCEAIYVVDANGKSSPTPSIADGNRILRNVIHDTRRHEASSFVGLWIASRNNIVKGNKVSMEHGRIFRAIKTDAGNQDLDNIYDRTVEKGDVEKWTRMRNQIRTSTPKQK